MDTKIFDMMKMLLVINGVRYLIDGIPPKSSSLEIQYGVNFTQGRDPNDKRFLGVGAVIAYLLGDDTEITLTTQKQYPDIFEAYLRKLSDNSCFCDFLSLAADLYTKIDKPLCRRRLEEHKMYIEDSPGKSKLLKELSSFDTSPTHHNVSKGTGCLLPIVAGLIGFSVMITLLVTLIF